MSLFPFLEMLSQVHLDLGFIAPIALLIGTVFDLKVSSGGKPCALKLCLKRAMKVDTPFTYHLCLAISAKGRQYLKNIREAIELYLEPVKDELVVKKTALVLCLIILLWYHLSRDW